MTLTTKILLIIIAVLVIGFAGFVIWKEHQINTMQTQIQQSLVAQQSLIDGITRSSSTYATKQDIQDLITANNVNMTAIQNNLSALQAQITGVNVITSSDNGNAQTGVPSTSTTPVPPITGTTTTPATCATGACDTYGYTKNIQNLQLNETFGTGSNMTSIPTATVSFAANQQKPWSYTQPERTYSVTNVLGTDKTGKQYVYNKFNINTGGKNYTVPITQAQFEQQYPSASFTFWNPRVFIGASGGVNVSTAPVKGEGMFGVHFGFMSYGQTLATPLMSFGQLGVSYGVVSKRPQIELSPLQYNLGYHLNFIRDTYVGPTVSVGTQGDFTVGAGLRVGL